MKILIFGRPKTGKSTLANALNNLINCKANTLWAPEFMTKLNGSIWLDEHEIQKRYSDWTFSMGGLFRQAMRMRYLADGINLTNRIAIIDSACPTDETRTIIDANYTIWMNTILIDDDLFDIPNKYDYCITEWIDSSIMAQNIIEILK